MEHGAGYPGRLSDVISLAFADVMEQQSTAQQVRAIDLAEELRETGMKVLFRSRNILQRLNGQQRVLVDCVAMVEIANDEAIDVVPLRDDLL